MTYYYVSEYTKKNKNITLNYKVEYRKNDNKYFRIIFRSKSFINKKKRIPHFQNRET